MPRLNHLTLLLLACCCCIFSAAQTNNCSAYFNYSTGNNNAVTFNAHDSVAVSHRWIFGDASAVVTSDKSAITHQYAKAGQYEVKHIIENTNSNCRDTVVKIITVEWLDQCNAYWNFTKDLANLSLRFHNSSSTFTGIKTIRWDFGDGSTAGSQDPVHSYAKEGTYTVCLNIETNNGCKSEYCSDIRLIDSVGNCLLAPEYYYYSEPDTCKKIHFINTSGTINSSVQFSWNFGDGITSNDLNPVHNYVNPGKYYVCLVAEAGANCRQVYCDTVVIVWCDPCGTALSYSYSQDSLNCTKINFKTPSSNTASGTTYSWNFGDGTTSHDINPSHTYSQAGNYFVCLVTETGPNCRKEYCDTIKLHCGIRCNIEPSFSWKTDGGYDKIKFSNLTGNAPSTIAYAWTFGDGSSSQENSPLHIYTHAGNYTVCLVAENGNDCRKETCQQIIIEACNITARFEKQHDAVQWNNVHFNNVSGPVNNIWRTSWTYGDGSSSQDYNSFHLYDKPGVYNVCLKIISLNGCNSVYCDTVTIVKNASCTVNSNFSHYSSPASSLSIKFEALYQSNSNTAQYNWNFGDNSIGAGRIAFHDYDKAGKYNVCVTIKDGDCSVTYCEEITIEKSANGNRVAVFPNPAVNTVSIDVNLARPGQLSIRILDVNGAVRSSFNKNGVLGTNRYSLPVHILNSGLYLVEIKSNDDTWYKRFVKGQ